MQQTENSYVRVGDLAIAGPLYQLIGERIAPAAGFAPEQFWEALETLLSELGPENRRLLARRDDLQEKIDEYHRQRGDRPHDPKEYGEFLRDIGYLVDEGVGLAV